MKEIQRFWELLESAHQADKIYVNTFELEPFLLAILELVKSIPHLHQEFVQCFIEFVDGEKNPCDLLSFCVRELQWAEVREAVERKIDDSQNWRVKTPLSHVLEVYDDAWEDADLWNYHST